MAELDPDNTTEIIRKRYDRNAAGYDLSELLLEALGFHRWRRLLWSKVEGSRILEVGVGTGKNFPYYPPGAEITAVDFSDKMLHRAREKAGRQMVNVRLQQMDVQQLDFADDSFDTVVASFVFCSVPDPVRGLKEVARVCRPGGKVVLLEHVLSARPIMEWLMNRANPLVVRLIGANINRRTVVNVLLSGLIIGQVTDLSGDVFKLIEAKKKEGTG